MKTELDEIVSEAFCRVTEQLAFMFAEPVDKAELPVAEGECLEVCMRFSGALEGTLRLAVPAAICSGLAENMLGADLEAEQAEAKGNDALKEVLNVTCGNILTGLAGMEPVFALTIPEAAGLEERAWTELLEDADVQAFVVEEYPALLQFEMKRTGA